MQKTILKHEPEIPFPQADNKEIVQIMKKSDLFNVQSEETFKRRSSTIKSWLNWIVGLIND